MIQKTKKKQQAIKNNPLQLQKKDKFIDDKKINSPTTTTKLDYKQLCNKLLKDEEIRNKSFPRLNKIFIKKMKDRNSEICFWHRWTMKENYKGNNLIIRQFRHNNSSFSRSTIYDWINWLREKNFIFKKKGIDEFVPSENYLKCLQQNALEIIKICNDFEKEKIER
jgi:hypothetical protein